MNIFFLIKSISNLVSIDISPIQRNCHTMCMAQAVPKWLILTIRYEYEIIYSDSVLKVLRISCVVWNIYLSIIYTLSNVFVLDIFHDTMNLLFFIIYGQLYYCIAFCNKQEKQAKNLIMPSYNQPSVIICFCRRLIKHML